MADLVMVVTIVAFVMLCVAYIGWCDRIIVRDQGELADAHAEDEMAGRPANPAPLAEVTA